MGLRRYKGDRGKVMDLIKYLNCTLSEFHKRFNINKNVFEDILLDKSSIPLRSKLKIMRIHPEISSVWLEFGTGDMTSGLIPNSNLLDLLKRLTELDEVKDILNSKFMRFLCRQCSIDIHEMTLILNNRCQINFPIARRLGNVLGINPYSILAMYRNELEYDKDKMTEFMKGLDKFKDKHTISKYAPRLTVKELTNKDTSPIYHYLENKISDSYLKPSVMNRELGISSSSNILYTNKTISKETARLLCERFNLDIDDMRNAGIITEYLPKSSNIDSEFYRLIKCKLNSTDSLTQVSDEIGIDSKLFLSHVRGNKKIGAKSAVKYYKYFKIDFIDLVSDRHKGAYIKEVSNMNKGVSESL